MKNRPASCWRRSVLAGLGPIRAEAQASVHFYQHILQHGFVWAKIGNQLLQTEILFLKLPHMRQF